MKESNQIQNFMTSPFIHSAKTSVGGIYGVKVPGLGEMLGMKANLDED